jgi:hypothetical protein
MGLHESDARPIAKGRLGKPVEFGYKGQVVDNDDGVVLDHSVHQGNLPDAPQLAPAIERVIKRTGRQPRTVTADRSYGEKRVDDALRDLGGTHRRHPWQRQTGQGPPRRRTPARVPQDHEMANRVRRPDQQPQTRIWLGPNPPGWHQRNQDLDRTRALAHILVKIGTLAG